VAAVAKHPHETDDVADDVANAAQAEAESRMAAEAARVRVQAQVPVGDNYCKYVFFAWVSFREIVFFSSRA